MDKQGNRQFNWRRISAAVVAVSILFAALFTAVHAADTGFRLMAVEMVAAAGGATDGETDSQKSAALPGDCDMHCNQHAQAFPRVAAGFRGGSAGQVRVAARDDRGLYSAPQWGILEPPRV